MRPTIIRWYMAGRVPADLRRTRKESFDEAAFLSPHVFRAVSKCYENTRATACPRLDRLRADRIEHAHVRSELETGAGGCGCPSTTW